MLTAIILAGGRGSRMNSDVAKQYIKIANREILYYSMNTFQKCELVDSIVLVTRDTDIDFCKTEIVERYGFDKVVAICRGGQERYNSVCNGINCLGEDYRGLVMIHDGARPFVTERMIADSVAAASKYGACTVGMPVKDTIKLVNEEGFGIETPDRNKLYMIQTPQTFKYEIIREAYDRFRQDENKEEHHNITDDTMLVEQYVGVASKLVKGSYNNIKITTSEDIEIAEKILEKI
ncbi:MAG: 2-C-methyl-D-erythritol 4-phosphate cytidylyltransferase [Wujia sp.]